MNNNTLTAGVTPDGLKNKTDIKILICYIISRFSDPISREDIITIINERGLANYLELCDAFSNLLDAGNISVGEDGVVSLTENGKQIAGELSSGLPRTVVEKSVAAMDHFLRRRRNERDNIFETEQLEDGWRVTCRIMNGQQELMSVCLYVPDAKYVEIVRNRFFDDPEYIYRINMSYLTNSKSIAPGGKQQ